MVREARAQRNLDVAEVHRALREVEHLKDAVRRSQDRLHAEMKDLQGNTLSRVAVEGLKDARLEIMDFAVKVCLYSISMQVTVHA